MSGNKNGFVRIVCAGEKSRLFVKKDEDYVIAADGGLKYCREAGIAYDAVIGDFDSLGFVPSGENVTLLPKEKDDTDTLAAVKAAEELGYDKFFLYCAAGGECDHTLANISVLCRLAKKGKCAYMYDGDRVITIICNEKLIFSAKCSGKLSVFSYGERAKTVISGMKYEYDGELTYDDYPLGCGNEFIGKTAEISADLPTVVIFSADIFDNGLFERKTIKGE